MIHSIVYNLPVGVLPYVETVLLIVLAIAVLMMLLCFFRLNRWIAGVILLTLATGLWVTIPAMTDEISVRQATERMQQTSVHAVTSPATPAAATDTPQAPAAATTAPAH
ncbi:hypothetical protein FE236_05770 [Mariprofundus erugo]|uniref:Uncharacterized protein n=1 Tax=Mariprofundus erugo TaxID=2528639 RepID=A0A5R9GRQ3_9PROT|nr:hypothetical protein [Mariprofundus erugo]TLS68590.1 hypothetical protein FEF65_02465 [Mariprofundus erugo]TLS76954.1 hypothetical protein FE236_05770 [Mariprofundus erugo]